MRIIRLRPQLSLRRRVPVASFRWYGSTRPQTGKFGSQNAHSTRVGKLPFSEQIQHNGPLEQRQVPASNPETLLEFRNRPKPNSKRFPAQLVFEGVMSSKAIKSSTALPQPVATPLTRAAIFLVLTVRLD